MSRRSSLASRRQSASFRAAVRAAACAVLLASSPTSPLRAQQDARGLTIDEVIAATLRENPDIREARAEVDVQRAGLVQAARPFDARPTATLSSSRTELSRNVDVSDPTWSYSSVEAGSDLAMSKMFRSGVSITSDAALARTSLSSFGGPTTNVFTLTTGLTVPLMQGRHGGIFTAAERAAGLERRASERTLRATAGAAVLGATVAYWQYRAAYQRAVIQRAAAGRAQRTVDEVKILIAADERPRSDIDLMIANAATKQVAEVEADRQIVHARNALALAIGLDLEHAVTLGGPSTDFPDVEATEPLPLEALIAEAMAHQDQLAAASLRREGTQILGEAAAQQMRPRVDLVLSGGYSGVNNDRSLGRTFGSVFGNVLGPNVSLSFVFEPSNVNSSLRGALIEANAHHTQAAVAADRLGRSIRLDVADALTDLTSSRAQLTSTREAVARARTALETVQRNFELGAATLFDRILAEDTVTNAELADLTASLQHATALVNLQFARGVLIDGQGLDLTADPIRVLRARPEDAK